MAPTASSPVDDVFDTAHYAASPAVKLRRAVELALPYYFWYLPKYLRHRVAVGLPAFDAGAVFNPLREFLPPSGLTDRPLPPAYFDALNELRRVGVVLSIPPVRLEALSRAWWMTREVSGAFIECGAYRGATSLFVATMARRLGIAQRTFVLDSFVGAPTADKYDVSRSAGEFMTPEGQTARIMAAALKLGVHHDLEIIQGLFSDSFAKLQDRSLRFAFAHIDANLYVSTLEACEFTLPRMAPGGVVVFDDYNGSCDLGARLAIDVALRTRGDSPQPLATTSAYLRC